MTKVWEAFRRDPDLPRWIDQIIFMGGVWSPLLLNGKSIDELDFSVDPDAVYAVFQVPMQKVVITGNLCLEAFFGEDRLRKLKTIAAGSAILRFAEARVREWAALMSERFGVRGFHIWDAVAAVYLTNPELFDTRSFGIGSTVQDLSKGLLRLQPADARSPSVCVPTHIRDTAKLFELLFDGRKNASPPCS